MSQRVVAALRAVQIVAQRPNPTEALAVGAIAAELRMSLSGASRLCSDLEQAGYLERAGGYGAYRLGRSAIQLSGRAAAPYARSVRYALTLAAQHTGETVFLSAPSADGLRVIASVGSAWTLHSPADVGELLANDDSASLRAWNERDSEAGETQHRESTIGMSIEVAAPIENPAGECVAVLAARLPVNRAAQNLARTHRAITAAKRSIERALVDGLAVERIAAVDLPPDGTTRPALDAAFGILTHLAGGEDSIAGTARATGLRADRTQRLIESCLTAGLIVTGRDRSSFSIGWIVHGWYRAAAAPTMVERGKPVVAETANATRTCGFITVLKGMRSFTLVEELEMAGEGLQMSPWLGRPHPIIGSDGGPTLLMDLDAEQLALLFPSRHTAHEFEVFLKRVRRVRRDGVLAMEAFDDAGIVSISAPIRDASGTVVAAACIVGTTDYMRANVAEFEDATRALATRVSALLDYVPHPVHQSVGTSG